MSKSEENQASRLPWRDIWQVPALVVAVLLLAGGLAAAKFTAPKADYGMMLDRVESLLAQDDYTDALGLLNTKIYPYVSRDGFAQVHRARFHLLRARGLYYGQRAMGISRQDNNENIIGEFLNAERLDAVMNTRDLFGIADTYIALGEIDRALAHRLCDFRGERGLRSRTQQYDPHRGLHQRITDPCIGRSGPAF